MSASMRACSTSFEAPDERVTKGGAEVGVLKLGDMKVKRASYPP
jgi:hypothetical protein